MARSPSRYPFARANQCARDPMLRTSNPLVHKPQPSHPIANNRIRRNLLHKCNPVNAHVSRLTHTQFSGAPLQPGGIEVATFTGYEQKIMFHFRSPLPEGISSRPPQRA